MKNITLLKLALYITTKLHKNAKNPTMRDAEEMKRDSEL